MPCVAMPHTSGLPGVHKQPLCTKHLNAKLKMLQMNHCIHPPSTQAISMPAFLFPLQSDDPRENHGLAYQTAYGEPLRLYASNPS